MNVIDVNINYREWHSRQKPFGLSGCFRLRNESEFMEAAVMSHLRFLDEVCLIVQPSEDDTVEKAHRMADRLKKVKVFIYPHVVDWIDTPGFYEKDPNEPGHLVHMSNWALSRCSYSWIVKVEGDVIGLQSFGAIREAIERNPDRQMYYGRTILNLAGEDCDQFSVTVPTNGGWDEAVFNNDPLKYRFVRSGKWEMVPAGDKKVNLGLSALHMKRCKNGMVGWNDEEYAPFTKNHLERIMKHVPPVLWEDKWRRWLKYRSV